MAEGSPAIRTRVARVADLEAIAEMVEDFVKAHPAASHPRPLEALRAAYFGPDPVAEIVVAERRGRVVGMAQWARIYDMFWAMFGGRGDWLYVRPRARGLGIPAALLATICARVRESGGEFLMGAGNRQTHGIYARSAGVGGHSVDFHLSAEGFQQLADLHGRAPREIVRRLPGPELNEVPARPRS